MFDNIVHLNPKHKSKQIDAASKELAEYLINQANKGVPLEALIGLLDVYKTNITLEILTFEDR